MTVINYAIYSRTLIKANLSVIVKLSFSIKLAKLRRKLSVLVSVLFRVNYGERRDPLRASSLLVDNCFVRCKLRNIFKEFTFQFDFDRTSTSRTYQIVKMFR